MLRHQGKQLLFRARDMRAERRAAPLHIARHGEVEQYAMRKIDAFVERDLPRLAEEAIDKQLADLAGD